MASLTTILSSHLNNLQYEDLPPESVEKAKDLLLDYLGYTIYGSDENPARILRKTFTELGGPKESLVLGHNLRLPTVNAAFLNGSTGHMAELDDSHRGTQSHVGDSVLAAALAIAEKQSSDGKELLTAITCGYEMAIRVGLAGMPSHYTKGWHPSGSINTFGAAMAAGKLLNHTDEQATQTVAIAGGQVAGNFAHLGERAMMKDFNPGRAASNGVLAALLGKNNFTGGTNAIENPKGFLALYSDTHHIEELTTDLNGPRKILEVAHKPFPGCRHLHSSRDALIDILKSEIGKSNLTLDDVEQVTARIYEIGADYVDDPEPWAKGKGIYGPSFSAQFNLALVLQEGEKGLWELFNPEYSLEKVNESKLQAMMGKINIVHDQELMQDFPDKIGAEVTLTTNEGSFKRRVDLPKGEPENPITKDELHGKFTVLTTARGFSNKQCAEVIQVITNLDTLENTNDLTNMLIPEH